MTKLTVVRTITAVTVLLCLSSFHAVAQVTSTLEEGMKPYHSYEGGDIDSINMVNGTLALHIPLISYPQRGGKIHVGFSLQYHNPQFIPSIDCKLQQEGTDMLCLNPYVTGYTYSSSGYGLSSGPAGNQLVIAPDLPSLYLASTSSPYFVVEPDNATHELDQWSIDATGYQYQETGDYNHMGTGLLRDRQGTLYSMTTDQPTSIMDVSGNVVALNGLSWTDTLGRTIPTFAAAQQTADFSGCVPTGSVAPSSAYLWNLPGPNGGTSQFKVCMAQFPLSYTVTSSSGSFTTTGLTNLQIQSIVLPNSTAWAFQFNSNGDLAQITLPTGGSISYNWTYTSGTCVGTTQSLQFPEGQFPNYARAVTSRTLNDQTGPHTWIYSLNSTTLNGGVTTTTVTDPNGYNTVHTATALTVPYGICSQYENELDQYGPSSTLLKKTTTTYQYTSLNSGVYVMNVVPHTITTTDMVSGKTSMVVKSYDSGVSVGSGPNVVLGELLSQSDYDFGSIGSGAPGPLIRQTQNTYMEFSGPNAASYLNENLLSLPYTVQVTDGTGTQVAFTQYNYDESPLASSGLGSSNQFYLPSSYTSVSYPPGNNTSVLKWLNSGTLTCPNGKQGGSGGYLISKKTYFDAGMLNTSADACGNTTTYAYNSCWGAYPTTVTNALGQRTQNNYDCNTGILTSTTDPNGLSTTYGPIDTMWRVNGATRPDGGTDTITRQESTPCGFTTTLTTTINSNLSKSQTNVFDCLGRISQTQKSDPQGTDYVNTTYDALGHVSTVSNPYRGSGGDATSSLPTWVTTYGYDALSRKISERYPDNSVLTTAYCGPTTLVTDPTGRWRRSTVNAIGQLVEVDEPNTLNANVNPNGCPAAGDQIWVTSYTNDALGNLTNVLQNGSHARTFHFDSVSRMLSSNNPESGTISYVHNPDNTVQSKTDARSISTSYTYDALHRVTGVSYSNGDPSVGYTYDQANCLNLGGCQNIGHRTGMSDASGSEAWAYNVVPSYGSVHQNQRSNNTSAGSINMTTTYVLDFAGNVVQMSYPTGRTVNYTYDSANRPSTAADAANGIIYATGWQTVPTGTSCLPGEACYTPQGSIAAVSEGQSCSSSGFNIQESYNSRLQPNEITASSGVGPAIDISYSFVDPNGGNAGHVNSITNNLNSDRSQTFTYDQVNRITSAGTSATTGPYCWGYQYFYDNTNVPGAGAWGNLTSQQGWTSNYGACSQLAPAPLTTDGNNHFTAFSYDQAGNTTNDTFISDYTWNGESQLSSANGVSYSYDGAGRRVTKAGSKFYWYGSGGEILAETDGSGNTLDEYVFFGGRRVAVLPASGTPLYYGQDMLGTSRVMVGADGTLCYDADFTPFGAELPYTSTCSQNYKFEGKERDTETQNDDFGARYYSWRYGRWLSSDWSSVPAPVPYANLTNPQTLNLYSMVSDDPESFADLDGHEAITPAWKGSDGQPNPCTGVGGPDNCGVNASQPSQQGQQQQTKPCPVDACVTATLDYVTVPRTLWSAVLGHHFIPKALWKNLARNSRTYRFLNKWVSGALSKGSKANQWNELHRGYNKDVGKLLNEMERDLGKGYEEFKAGDWQELGSRIESAGGDIEGFLGRLEELEPQASSLMEGLEGALPELGAAAAEDAAAGEVIIP